MKAEEKTVALMCINVLFNRYAVCIFNGKRKNEKKKKKKKKKPECGGRGRG